MVFRKNETRLTTSQMKPKEILERESCISDLVSLLIDSCIEFIRIGSFSDCCDTMKGAFLMAEISQSGDARCSRSRIERLKNGDILICPSLRVPVLEHTIIKPEWSLPEWVDWLLEVIVAIEKERVIKMESKIIKNRVSKINHPVAILPLISPEEKSKIEVWLTGIDSANVQIFLPGTLVKIPCSGETANVFVFVSDSLIRLSGEDPSLFMKFKEVVLLFCQYHNDAECRRRITDIGWRELLVS